MIATRTLAGFSVPELGFGAAPLGNLYRTVSDADAADALAAALAAGMRHIDTAPYYGFGLSETRVGAALRSEQAILSSKAGRLLHPLDHAPGDGERHGFRSPMPFEPVFDYTLDGVLRSHEASRERLGRAIDILYIHDIGRRTHGADHDRRMAELTTGRGFAALHRLRDEGAIRAFGIGVNEITVCLEMLDLVPLDAILLAGRYTLLEQEALDTLMPRCLAEGTALVIGGPYNSGVLVDGAHYDYAPAPPGVIDKVHRIRAICARHGVPTGAAALHFILAHPAVTSVIPGLASAAEVKATLDWYQTPIPADLWAELQEEKLLRPDAPVPQAAPCA